MLPWQIIAVEIDIYLNDLAMAITLWLMNADINVKDKHWKVRCDFNLRITL